MSSKLCPYCMKMSDGDTCPHCGKKLNYVGSPAHLPVGYVVSGRHPYVLGAALGQGGFGITYIALDMVTNTRVAIKEYFPTHCSGRTGNHAVTAYQNQEEVYRKGKERFLDEARTLKNLSDLKSIVNVLDFFEANNSAYLVMEFLEGISLKGYAARKGKFPARKFLNQIKPLMEDLQRMHERGVIHRDIAPDNIMLLPDGRMKLIDFGAARSFVSGKSMTLVVKKGFAPVEQYLSHGSTASTDVYALAATIYYCTTGKVPPDSADREYAGIALASPVSLGADLTPQQEKAILKAMKVQQKERTQTVKEFLDALQQKRRPFLFLTPRGKKFLLLILAALAAILILIGIYLADGKDSLQGSLAPSAPASETGDPAPQQTEKEQAATEPTETEVSGKPSKDKPASGQPSSGSSSSGGSSSGSGSSSGNSPSSGDSPAPTAPADRPSYDDPVPDNGSSGGNSSDNDSPANNPPADQPVSPPATSPSNPEPAPPPTTGPAPGGSSSGSGSTGGSSSGGDTTGGSSSGGSNTGSGSSGGSSGGLPSFDPPGSSSNPGSWLPGGGSTGGAADSGSASGDSSGY